MKHNERISPEAEFDYPEHFPFQHHQRQQKLAYAAPFIPPIPALHLSLVSLHTHFLRSRVTSLWVSNSVIRCQLCCLTPVNRRRDLLWNYTDLGHRLVLSHLTKPGLKVRMLFACHYLDLDDFIIAISRCDFATQTKGSITHLWFQDDKMEDVRVHLPKKIWTGSKLGEQPGKSPDGDGWWAEASSLSASFCTMQLNGLLFHSNYRTWRVASKCRAAIF